MFVAYMLAAFALRRNGHGHRDLRARSNERPSFALPGRARSRFVMARHFAGSLFAPRIHARRACT